MRLDVDLIKSQIAALRYENPGLEDDEEAWLLSLESETELDEMLRAIERKRQEAKSLHFAIGENINELAARASRFEAQERRMRDLTFKLMNAAELTKKVLPEATLSISNGRPKVTVYDATAIPDDLIRTIREPDKGAIKERLDAGQDVPGAHMSNPQPYLTIRTK